jgi:hypothetical protein
MRSAWVLVSVVLASAALVLAACGGSGDDGSPPIDRQNPHELAETAGFEGVKSGELELALEIDSQGKEEEVNMRIVGSFIREEGEVLPKIDGAIESNGKLSGRAAEFFGGPTLLPDRAVVNYESKVYQPDKTTFEALKAALEEAQEEGGEGSVNACREAAAPIELRQLVKNLSFGGMSTGLDGKPVWVASADLDVAGAIDALAQMSKDPECGAQLEAVAPHLAEELAAEKDELAKETKKASVVFSVDKNNALRTISVDWIYKPKHPKGEEIEVEFDLRLNRINEVTELPRPHGYQAFDSLLKQFGLDLQTVREVTGDELVISILETLGQDMTGSAGS